ncbi:unnamed protein product [Aureobasidium vineae]|uniref:Uncharacterized protein n=1 Tax=Aureobasidium vineae TaxID=2773715 RepID=A0A9N8JCX7_9PEZI|nr:unnamed protein product [Aureobasidium vineae]
MAVDKGPRVRKTSISSSNSFILTCQHWFNAALNRLPFRRRFSPTQSLRARPSAHSLRAPSSPQTPERAPTPPPRPAPFVQERVTFSIQAFAPQGNNSTRSSKSAAIAEPEVSLRARSNSGLHLLNSRRALNNSD